MKPLLIAKTEFIRCLFFWGVFGLISCDDYDAYKCTTGTCRVFIAPMEQSSGPFNPGNTNTNTYQQ